ncbi:MAG TPA: hypothetical protein PKI14_15510 [Fervidobacterium sp.]|nr:hypothetical protein [Fervidobacterium sp.]
MMVNEMVQIHKGTNSMGGMFIYEDFIEGKVVKVNKKSIRVHMTHAKCITNGKITREYDIDETATFEFWKTVETAGKTVSIFKNNKYGIIKIAH